MSAESVELKPRPGPKRPVHGQRPVHLSDTQLVRECLRGREEAWNALVDKYKNLIFSIPIKYGLSRDDASDIFQGVCLELLSQLPKLRNAKALPKWVMQIAAHKCFHRKKQFQRTETRDFGAESTEETDSTASDAVFKEAEEEQLVRDSLSVLPPRCRQLIEMLFFEEPPRPYNVVAEELGLAVGSIGFIRQRCLDKLRKRLSEAGFA